MFKDQKEIQYGWNVARDYVNGGRKEGSNTEPLGASTLRSRAQEEGTEQGPENEQPESQGRKRAISWEPSFKHGGHGDQSSFREMVAVGDRIGRGEERRAGNEMVTEYRQHFRQVIL